MGGLGVPVAGRNAAVEQELGIVHATMVGTEEHGIVAFAHLLVEIIEEISEVLVQAEIGVFYLHGVRTYLVADDISARATYGEEVSLIATTEILASDSRLCHLQGITVAERSAAQDVVAILLMQGWEVEWKNRLYARLHFPFIVGVVGSALLVSVDRVEGVPFLGEILLRQVLLVEVVHPCRQLVHIETAGDKLACLWVKPVGTIGMMTGREDGGTVLDGNADYLAAVVGGDAKFIADGGTPHVAWRFHARLAVGTNRFHGVVLSAVCLLAVLHEVVASDAMDGRNGACIDRGVTDGGDRRDIRDATILVAESLVQQTLESTLAITILIAIEVIPSHLVNYQSHHEFRSGRLCLCLCETTDGAKHEDEFEEFVHSLLCFIIVTCFKFGCKDTINLLQNYEKQRKFVFHVEYILLFFDDFWVIYFRRIKKRLAPESVSR